MKTTPESRALVAIEKQLTRIADALDLWLEKSELVVPDVDRIATAVEGIQADGWRQK